MSNKSEHPKPTCPHCDKQINDFSYYPCCSKPCLDKYENFQNSFQNAVNNGTLDGNKLLQIFLNSQKK
jgi:transposase-like protein